MFTYSKEELTEKKAINTAEEINQQPDVWEKVWDQQGLAEREKVQKFIKEIFNQHVRGRVIFSGAGTSAFIGDMLVPELIQHFPAHFQVESIPTTDLVSNPKNYFREDIPTVLVSFGRSGNSPESIAATELGQKIVDDFYQIVITCNEDGILARNIEEDKNSQLLLLPPETHDKGFAMTSSFSAMTLTAYLLFEKNNVYEEVSALITNARHALENVDKIIDQVLSVDFDRMVYLGSGTLGQASHEAALKMLELTAGKVVALHESSLGFRHGPKSVLNEHSVAVVFVSQNPYTRQYDLDMIKELANEDALSKVIALTADQDEEVKQLADITFVMTEKTLPNDLFLSLNYMLFAQVLSLRTSLKLGITPDNPSPEGSVNRVVQGVTIYDY